MLHRIRDYELGIFRTWILQGGTLDGTLHPDQSGLYGLGIMQCQAQVHSINHKVLWVSVLQTDKPYLQLGAVWSRGWGMDVFVSLSRRVTTSIPVLHHTTLSHHLTRPHTQLFSSFIKINESFHEPLQILLTCGRLTCLQTPFPHCSGARVCWKTQPLNKLYSIFIKTFQQKLQHFTDSVIPFIACTLSHGLDCQLFFC